MTYTTITKMIVNINIVKMTKVAQITELYIAKSFHILVSILLIIVYI